MEKPILTLIHADCTPINPDYPNHYICDHSRYIRDNPRSRSFSKTFLLAAVLSFLFCSNVHAVDNQAEAPVLSAGQVISNDINVRVDSSVGSEAICRIGRGAYLEITAERYDWYKIRLPENAPSYIKKEFVNMTEDDRGVVVNDKVNIRLRPDISSPILGKASVDEPITVLDTEGEWLKIKPVSNSFGWIHKNFVKRTEVRRAQLTKKGDVNSIIVEGKLRHKTFTRVATHKLTTKENKVYLLQGKEEDLNPLNDRSVRVTGKIVDPAKLKYPIIAVEKIEALD